MKQFKTKPYYTGLILVYFFILFLTYIFDGFERLNLNYIIIFLLIVIIVPPMSISQLIVDEVRISIKYPFNIFIKPINVKWSELACIQVIYTDQLVHLGKPSNITFILTNGKKIKMNLALKKKEYDAFKELAEINSVLFKRKGVVPKK